MIVHLNSKVAFTVRGPSILTNAKCSVSSQAFTYLSDFCHRHNLENQAKAGLGAALTFPSPLPASIHLQPVPDKTNISQPPKPSLEDSFSVMTNLMTISSAVTGLTATLNVYTPEPVNWRLVASKHNHWLLLKEVRSGTPFVNLPSWWWTQLPQSYICIPCPDPVDETRAFISRQKETTLLVCPERHGTTCHLGSLMGES
ncbi:hypothetical protein BDBG_02123 [Blastomyces gilchristii SLH14081]|uniref:Uncharacterized protein n=1 Tax=Blastomyces gilchristii (strain SLH14081) TaxID=559298 RepID=A0A179UDI2_BLAGS|nr:uncharacterized protein BDBG_02123 [Blastomyces gilchristii SLH14081]OAT05793.1 hypothetical protein BDBG_02123 [Blastomyces gilchristii SLH14081]